MNVKTPFLVVNPKSYLYGKETFEFAQNVDKLATQYKISVYFTCPYTDIYMIKAHTKEIIVTAQHMDALNPGRGMGHVLPESLKSAGAGAVFLNHAERPMYISELTKAIRRSKELNLISIVCADSLEEAKAIAMPKPDILLCEPTDLIGTGNTADPQYTIEAVSSIKSVDKNIAVMIASGVTTPDDVYRVMRLNADGTGATSGIIQAEDPVLRVKEMLEAMKRAVTGGQ